MSSWSPPARPDWVVAANAGDNPLISAEADQSLTPDALLAEAAARQGRTPAEPGVFGTDDFREPLDVFCRALAEEADLHTVGRWLTRRMLVRLLEVRIQLADLLARDPSVADEVIDEPVFVIGAPRTGTTVLHGLLARDPANRAPEGWELLRPVPPPTPETFESDPRIALCGTELAGPQMVSSGLRAIHLYSARMHKECLSAMSLSFRSEELVSRYRVPTYVDWLERCDMTPSYEMHRLVLQVLQHRFPPRRWALKSPVHLQALPVLVDVYPDALLVVTHRDPTAILASVSSLIATMRWAHSDAVDMAELGRYHADLYGRSLDRLVDQLDDGLVAPQRLAQVAHGLVTTDGIAAARSVYAQLGLELDVRAEAAMSAFLRDTPPGKHGEHRYSFDDLGLDADDVRNRFARYIDRFDVATSASEGGAMGGGASDR
ncbi:MAG: sulfotransferase [Acidimicrobiales bacterium]|nr:sulfotransferase [Acidimicrobiales bacterium]